MEILTDSLITAALVGAAIFVPKLRKPIGILFAVMFVVVIALRLHHT